MKKIKPLFSVFLICFLVLASIPQIKVVKAQGNTIYIRADGTVEGTDKIQRTGNMYSFTDTIDGSIVVESDNVVVDGAGYTIDASSSFAGLTIKPAIPLYGEYISNVTIRNVVIVKGEKGILMQSTNNSIIANNTISNVGTGIMVDIYGTGNLIAGNNLTNISGNGIWVWTSNNTIIANSVANSGSGIYFSDWTGNTVTGNHIGDNQIGINCWAGIPIPAGLVNLIYGNNFINNTSNFLSQAILKFNSSELLYPALVNVWDNGTLGNYWSNYNGTDSDGDGIGDTPYIINDENQDKHPLIEPIDLDLIPESTDSTPLFEEKTFHMHDGSGVFYQVTVVSNSTVSDFYFLYASMRISFYVNGTAGTTGLCNITIPSEFMSTEFSIFKDEMPLVRNIDYTETFNGTHYLFTITYQHSTHLIQIYANNNIPEFPSWTILPLLIAATLVGVTVRNKIRKNGME